MRLRLMTWNIAWAYGKGSEGHAFQPRPEAEFKARLDRMAAIIREERADIVFLQEVDLGARRSRYINQMEYLSGRAGLPHREQAVSWRIPYIPYPYWPVTHHFGRMLSGGAILSRYPLHGSEVHLLPKPDNYGFLYKAFYIHRYFQVAGVEIDGRRWKLVNLHLEAFEAWNRMQQAERVADWLGKHGEGILAIGGDFNTAPLDAAKKFGFADEPETDYRGDHSMTSFARVEAFREVAPAGGTFPAEAPTRRLDHIFVPARGQVSEARVVECGTVSDHLPVVATLDLS